MINNTALHQNSTKDLQDGISIIIPTYKREKFITTCLESLNKQTLSKNLFEVILILNGEKDNTESIVNEFSRKTKMNNIKMFEIDEGSASLARNEGIFHASRKYSLFVDDDDYISENYLEEMYKHAKEDTIVISQIVNVDENGKQNKNSTINLQIKQQERKKRVDFYLLDKVATINSCKLIPTIKLKGVMFDPKLKSGEDIVFFVELLIKNDFTFEIIPINKQAIYYRRMLPNSISRQEMTFDFYVKQRLEVINRLDKMLTKVNDEKNEEFIKNKIDAQFLFINKYVLKNSQKRNDVINEIDKFNLTNIPSLINNNGLVNRIKFFIRLLKKPVRLLKLLLNK